MADFRVSGEASIDPDHIAADIDDIIAKLDEFSEKIDEIDEKLNRLSGHNVNISILIDGMDKLDELKIFLDDLDSREYLVKVRVDDIAGMAKLDDLKLKVDELTLRDHYVDLKVNTSGLAKSRAEIDLLTDSLKKNNSASRMAKDSTEGFAFSWAMLAPLLIPAAGAIAITAGGVLGLASALGTLVVPLAAVALATKSAYGEVKTFAGTLSTQLTAAISKAGGSFSDIYALLDKNSSAFRGMNDNMKEVVVEYFLLKNALSAFESAIQPETMGILSLGMQTLQQILQDITPAAIQAGDALEYVIAQFSHRLNDPTFQKFFSDMTANIGTLVKDWGIGVLNIIEGITAILDAFMPLGVKMSGGFLSMTQSFDTWAQHLAQSEGFKKFVAEVEKDGPVLLNILGQIVLFIGHLFGALNNSGQVDDFLTTVDKLLQAANQFMQAHPGLVQAGVDIGLIALSASKLLPMIGPLISFLTTPAGAIVAGVAALAIGFFLAYQNSKQFRDYVDTNLRPTLGKLEGDVKDVKQWFISIWPDIVKAWKQYGGNLENIVTDMFKGFEGIISGAITFIEGIIDVFLGLLTGNWSLVWKGLGKILDGAWRMIEQALSASLKIFGNLLAMAWKQISTDATSAWKGITSHLGSYFSTIESAASGLFSKLVTYAASGMSSFLSKIEQDGAALVKWFTGLPGQIISALGNYSTLLWNVGVGIMKGFLGGLKSMWNDVTGFFSSLTNIIPDVKGPPAKDRTLLTPAGEMIMESLNDGFNNRFAKVASNLQNMTKTIGSTFGNQFSKDINTQINASLENTANAGAVQPRPGTPGPGSGGGQQVTFAAGAIQITNPTPEAASTTLTRTLQGMSRFGSIQPPTGFAPLGG